MAKIGTSSLPYTPIPQNSTQTVPTPKPNATNACSPESQSCEPAPSNVCLPPKAAQAPQICSLFPEDAPTPKASSAKPNTPPKPAEKPVEKHTDHHAPPTVGGVLAHDVGVNAAHHAAEHGVHHLAHRAAARAATRAAQSGATRAAEHGAVRAAEHGAVRAAEHAGVRAAEHAAGAAISHGAAYGVGRIASVAAPGLGAAAAGYLAYKGVEHSIEAGKRGNTGAAIAFALAATVDGTTAIVNGAGAVTGAGTLISTPVSIGLGVVATGLSALGAYLDN